MRKTLLAVLLAAWALSLRAQTPAATPAPAPETPVYVSLTQDITQFGNWDANWYVGYNNCWLVKLPPIPAGSYAKAFIGAKLGRAKSMPLASKPWVKVPIEGKIFMGLAPVTAFSARQSYFLVESKDIPKEELPSEAVDGSGSAQWFWAEVPLSAIAFDKPNYLAIWSDSELFNSAETAPTIAGAETKDITASAWVNGTIQGTAPRDPNKPSGTEINGMAPAMALKLVPQNAAKPVIKDLLAIQDSKNVRFSFSVEGRDVRTVWLEISYDRFDWQRISHYLYQPPYIFTIPKSQLPSLDMYFIRAAATDTLENTAYGKELPMH